ncbi:reverse transcriptase domain-containing protein [Tanacetum coccineum]|uniref:Reverse transcriptase domain-containing protein n=1 Tax=Tanacetum coccineum TaxID=301880 RepID=A0ABQ5IJB3_9ASTR
MYECRWSEKKEVEQKEKGQRGRDEITKGVGGRKGAHQSCFSRAEGEGKFLGYMVTSEGISINPKKTKAVADMQSPKTLKEMQSFSRKLAALNRFLSRSAEQALPFFETLKNITKKNKDDYRWTNDVEHAFQEMKKLIIELPALITPVPEEMLYVYLVASQNAVSGVLVADRKGKQTPIRYLSRRLHEAERNYAPLENLALCLLHLSRRLCRYFEGHPIKSSNPTTSHMFLGTLSRGRMDLVYGRGLKPERSWYKPSPDRSNQNRVKVDSKLVACQLNSEFVASSEGMTKCLTKAKEHVALFKKFSIENIPQNQNKKADVLSKLASAVFNHLTKEVLVEVLNVKSMDVQEVNTIVEEEDDNWMTPIIKCLEEEVWSMDKNEARTLRMKISQYVMEE